MKGRILFVLYICIPTLVCAQTTKTEYAEFDTCAHLDEVVVTGVTGSARLREIAAPISIISNAALQAYQSTNIINSISRQPGVNQITTGSGISKPIIRGLGYNRVLVVNDGIRQEGQQWGDEHGIEIDGQAIHSVEILKGPGSLMYGSDAMAGAIIMHDAPTMMDGEMYAEVGSEYQTNNGLIDYTLNFKGNQNGIVWNWRWTQKFVHDYKAPVDGYVFNSRFREKALNGMLGINKQWGFSQLKLSYYHLMPGMTEIEDEYIEGTRKYNIDSPFQKVNHYKAIIDNHVNFGEGYLKAIVGYQQNRRQEFEDDNVCGLDFKLHSINYDIKYVSPEWNGYKTNFGFGGMYQKSENLGDEYLIPAYNLFDIGLFATVSKTYLERIHMSGGLRYDHRHLHSQELFEDEKERFRDFTREFNALSGSIGMIYNINDQCDFKANISHGFRAPNMSELGSNGVHEGTFRYELGNSNLKSEHSWQFDIGLDYSGKFFSASVALFANRISDYIYLHRIGNIVSENEDGIMEDMPSFMFTSGDARIIGGEARLILHILRHLHFENSISIVDARLLKSKDGNKYLPFTPAPRILSTLHYDVTTNSKNINGIFAEIEVDNNFKQKHVMKANDTETPTSAYSIVNLTLGTNIYLSNGRKLCNVGLSATNIFNKAYQSHLSRLKYVETFEHTGRYGINNMGRNIGIKIFFPIDI